MSSISEFFLQFATAALQLATMSEIYFFKKNKVRAKKLGNSGLELFFSL
jgi:hypothetical protein